MKVFAVSDLHLSGNNPKPMDIFGGSWANYMQEIEDDWRQKVGEQDTVLIAGDISWAMTLTDALPDLRRIGALLGKKVYIRGNHDYWWKAIGAVRSAVGENAFAVQNDCVRIENLLVCGSRGWTTPEIGASVKSEDKKIYEREIGRIKLSLSCMQRMRKEGDYVVAMIHYPPFNSRMESSPFTELFAEYAVNAVVYGHLHGNGGRLCLVKERDGIPYYLTSCDIVKNKLVTIAELA